MIRQACVYCASSSRVEEKYFVAARALADVLVDHDIKVVFGGGSKGLMGALADQVIARKGQIKGIIPAFMKEVEWDHPQLTELLVTETMHERKQEFLRETDVLIALPGGCGTLEELIEAITWKRLGLFVKPIVLVNTDGFYDPLIQMLERCVEERFMDEKHLRMWTVIREPKDLLAAIDDAPDWDSSAILFASM